MNLVECLKQRLRVDGAHREQATPKRIAEALGHEDLTMNRGLRIYDVTDKVKEQKLKGLKR